MSNSKDDNWCKKHGGKLGNNCPACVQFEMIKKFTVKYQLEKSQNTLKSKK